MNWRGVVVEPEAAGEGSGGGRLTNRHQVVALPRVLWA